MSQILRLWLFFQGYVIIRVEKVALERFLNLSVMQNILLWNIQKRDDYFEARMKWEDYKRVTLPFRQAKKYNVEIVNKVGFPFILKSIKQRKIFFAGAIIFLLIIYISSSLVWSIEIVGTEALKNEEILEIIEKEGLMLGVYHRNLNTKDIELAITRSLPRVEWVGLTIKGTKVIIEVVEKDLLEPRSNIDLIADRDGLIKEIIHLSGELHVEEGDTVSRGQLLISGQKENNEDDGYIQARGIVRARVWYECSGRIRIPQVDYIASDQKSISYRLKIGDKLFSMKGPAEPPYQYYNRAERKWSLLNWSYVSFVEVTYQKLDQLYDIFSYEQAVKKAVVDAEKKLQTKIGSSAEIIEKNIKLLSRPLDDLGFVEVKITAETIEEIGTRRDK